MPPKIQGTAYILGMEFEEEIANGQNGTITFERFVSLIRGNEMIMGIKSITDRWNTLVAMGIIEPELGYAVVRTDKLDEIFEIREIIEWEKKQNDLDKSEE